MTRHPIALALVLALAASAGLSGCDRTSSLTEQEHIQRAKDFEDKGNLRGSIVELKNAIQKNPNSPQARLLLGQVYLKVGMGGEAEKELTRAGELGISQESLKPQLGEALLLMGEYKRVLDEIQPGDHTSKANLARIYQMRAEALLRQGQVKDACNLFQQSLATDTGSPATYWGLANCAVAERDIAKAKGWLDQALKINDKRAKTWIHIGELEQQHNKNIDGALAAYSSALKLEPENLEALQSRATLNTMLGRIEPARSDVAKIRKLAPKSLVAHYLQALFDFHQKKYPEARDSLQEALKIAPDYLPALLLGGSIETALGNYQTAELHLNKVVRAAPRHGLALRMLATTQLRLGRPDDAARTLAPIDLEQVKDGGVLATVGEIALAKREYSKAASYFEKAAELSPDSATIRTELGMARLAQGDKRAMADLQAASSMEGSGTQADNVVILNQLKQKQFDAALGSIGALEKKQAQSPLPWNYRGVAYLGKNDITAARNSFSQALKLDPGFFPAAANLARLDILDKKPGAARKRFEDILAQDKTDTQAMLALADLAAQEKKESDYVGWLEKAAKADPKAIKPRAALARYYLAKKESPKALALANETVNANPDSLEALNLLGAIQMDAGDRAASISTYTRMNQKAPQSPAVLLRLALAQIADKQLGKARVNLQQAIQLKPDFIQAQDALLRLEFADNKPDAALRLAKQMQVQQPNSPTGYDREGDLLVSLKRPQEAADAYRQAVDRGAPTASLIKLLGAMASSGDQKGAERFLATWIERHPDDRGARSYAAQLHMRGGENKSAISQYEALKRLDPNDVSVANNLAILYQREKDTRALATAEHALKLAPENPGVQDTLGWILVEQGQFKRGLDLLGKAKAAAPKQGSIQYHYAAALARSGNRAEARRQLDRLVASGLKFPEIEEAKALRKGL